MSDVEIHHPAWGRTIRVPADLWPGRLAAKGWELAETSEQPVVGEADVSAAWNEAAAAPESSVGVDEKAQLQAVLQERGVAFDGRSGVKTLRRLVADTEATE